MVPNTGSQYTLKSASLLLVAHFFLVQCVCFLECVRVCVRYSRFIIAFCYFDEVQAQKTPGQDWERTGGVWFQTGCELRRSTAQPKPPPHFPAL